MIRTAPQLAALWALVGVAMLVAGCNVWRDFATDPFPASTCEEACPDDWWDDAWPYRARLVERQDLGEGDAIVLFVGLRPSELDLSEARDDRQDLRIILDGEELWREVQYVDDEAGTGVWVRFPQHPSPDQSLYVYWGNAEAEAPEQSPWAPTDYSGIYHLESDGTNSVPGGRRAALIGDTVLTEGRLGQGRDATEGDVRAAFDSIQTLPTPDSPISWSFSVRAFRQEQQTFSVVETSSDDCPVMSVSRTGDYGTELRWNPTLECPDTSTPLHLPVDVLDGEWHDIVAEVDPGRDRLRLWVDDQHAEANGATATDVTHRAVRFRLGGDGEVVYDEIRLATKRFSALQHELVLESMRGELFTIRR